MLAGLALLACAIILPPGAAGATPADLAQLLARARAETEARTLRAPDGTPLCFPPAAAVEGTEAHFINGYSGLGISGNRENDKLSGYVDVYIEQSDAPVLLILRGYYAIVWRLHVSEGARLGAVHLMGRTQNFVTGVPNGVPVTSRYRQPLARGEPENCVFAGHGPGGIYHLHPRGSAEGSDQYDETSFAYLSYGGRFSESQEVRALRSQLRDHADIAIASSQRPFKGGNFDERVEVSRRAIAKYEAVRQRGRDWLGAHEPPPLDLLGPNAETMIVPEGITGIAAMEWLAARGYAERTGGDQVEYLCDRNLAHVLLEGEDIQWDWDIQNCGERQFASQMFTILGPIRITEEMCLGKDRPALLIPTNVRLEWNPTCTWQRIAYPRDG